MILSEYYIRYFFVFVRSKTKDGLVKPKLESPKTLDMLGKNDHTESKKHSQKHPNAMKKIKSEGSMPGSPKVKIESEKKIKSESGTEGSPKVKVEGVKKIKTESNFTVSPKAEGAKTKVKSSTDDSDDDVPLVGVEFSVKLFYYEGKLGRWN